MIVTGKELKLGIVTKLLMYVDREYAAAEAYDKKYNISLHESVSARWKFHTKICLMVGQEPGAREEGTYQDMRIYISTWYQENCT
jgi:hypothetical protein